MTAPQDPKSENPNPYQAGGYGYPPAADFPPPADYPPPTAYPAAGSYPSHGAYPGHGPYPQSGAYPQPGAYSYAAPNMPAGTNGLAIASLITSLAGFACFLPGIVGMILGIVSLKQLKTSGEQGRGMAITGTIIGGVFTALTLAFIVLIIVLAATESAR